MWRWLAYNCRVLLEERDSLAWVLKALREAGSSLVMEILTVDGDMLRQRPSGDDWCVSEIAAHLRDAEELALRQVAAIFEGGNTLPFWDIDLLPAERDYQGSDTDEMLAEFRALRRETTSLLWTFSEREWRTSGQHPYRGEITLETLARELAQHDLEHLWQVRQLKHELLAEA